MVWYYTSAFPKERKTAGKRFRDLLGRGLDPEECLTALAEFAAGTDEKGQPFHAIGFTELVARAFIATIREREHLERKGEEREPFKVLTPLRPLDLSRFLGGRGA